MNLTTRDCNGKIDGAILDIFPAGYMVKTVNQEFASGALGAIGYGALARAEGLATAVITIPVGLFGCAAFGLYGSLVVAVAPLVAPLLWHKKARRAYQNALEWAWGTSAYCGGAVLLSLPKHLIAPELFYHDFSRDTTHPSTK